jgi:general secretion pathway protein K
MGRFGKAARIDQSGNAVGGPARVEHGHRSARHRCAPSTAIDCQALKGTGVTRRPAQDGYALILALWVLTLLTMASVAFVTTARMESRAASASLKAAEGLAIAEAGVWLAVASAAATKDAGSLAYAAARDFTFGDSAVTVEMRDVSGLINLNRASADLIDAAFASAGADTSARAGIVNAILDWRDADTDARDGGIEPTAYETSWGSVTVR